MDTNENLSRHKEIIKDFSIGIYRTTENGKIIEANSTLVNILEGNSKEDILKQNIKNFYLNKKEYTKIKQKLKNQKSSKNQIIKLKTLKGKPIVCSINIKKTERKEGIYLEGAIRTIKEKRSDLNFYKKLIDESNDSIYIIDPDTCKFLYVNKTGYEKLGYEKNELKEKKEIIDIIPEIKERKQWQNKINKIKKKNGLRIERKHKRKDGSTFPVEVNLSIINLDKEYLLAISRDITERKKREKRLHLFHEAVEQAGHAIYITDKQGNIEYVNPAFEKITGYNKKQAIDKNPKILKSGIQPEEYYEKLWNTLLSGNIWKEEIFNKRKNGEIYSADQTISPIKQNGEIKNFVAIQTDITDRKLKRQRLEVLHRVLRHNLRNKLNTILMNIDNLSKETKDKYEEYISDIKENISSLKELSEKAQTINDFLEYSEDDIKTINIKDILKEVKENIKEEYDNVKIVIDNKTSKSVKLDSNLYYAFKELVENGVEHNNSDIPKVKITISNIKNQEKNIKLSFIDNGVGIPEDEEEVLVRGEESSLIHGSGLGLWLVYWLVRINGGSIEISQNKPKGTKIDIILPNKAK